MKGTCSICPSEKGVRKYQGKKILCGKHREQMRRFGKIRERTLSSGNDYYRVGDTLVIITYGRDLKERGRFVISLRDKKRVLDVGSWCVDARGYVMSGKVGTLHKFLLGSKAGKEIDHKNGNKLDNRRENLRFVSHSENVANWHRTRRKERHRIFLCQLIK